ncbi:polysaccharide deacetylase family protein [Thalassotalea sediminis]|uniref:polysaccharide deacetylase family protein n=1 Tax=Thalassotalea sediminis TaxID=1759089 RepID=UPI0025742074|nr:polysaccharide deacetylase family protein [Thalassotalea sediminis]
MKNVIYLLLLLYVTNIAANEIAITFDDGPRADTRLFTGKERTAKLIKNLQKAKVEDALFFITTGHINEQSKARVNAYTNAGFHLANHSHSHFSAHNTALDTYLHDIAKAKNILAGFDNVLPYYRYPYLHEGKDRKTRDRIRQHLQSLGYKNGYVTVDNYDWYMDRLLQNALADGKSVDYEKLKQAYVSILWEAIRFYDDIGQSVLGRSPKHVLLLHENDIAALFIGDLVAKLRAEGWQIISAQEAFQDPIATEVPDVLFNGQGRVSAIAKSKGWENNRLRDNSSSEQYLKTYFEKQQIFQ